MAFGSRAQWQAILVGGVVAGSIDIGAASTIYQTDPLIVLRVVASGLLGKAAFSGGLAASALGAACQISISVVAAAIYVFAAGRFPILLRRPFSGGLVFGGCTYFVMNDIVVPLSAARSPTGFSPVLFAENMLAMLVFGWIIAFTAQRLLARRLYAPA